MPFKLVAPRPAKVRTGLSVERIKESQLTELLELLKKLAQRKLAQLKAEIEAGGLAPPAAPADTGPTFASAALFIRSGQERKSNSLSRWQLILARRRLQGSIKRQSTRPARSYIRGQATRRGIDKFTLRFPPSSAMLESRWFFAAPRAR